MSIDPKFIELTADVFKKKECVSKSYRLCWITIGLDSMKGGAVLDIRA